MRNEEALEVLGARPARPQVRSDPRIARLGVTAGREELVSRNVARMVELPGWEPGEVRPWSSDEALAFLGRNHDAAAARRAAAVAARAFPCC